MAIENIRVLIVEDDLLYAEQLRLDLEEMGFLVIDVADSAKSAIHMAKISRPEIILMDINLKGEMDGIAAAQQIFTMDPTPIIFVTSLSDKDTFERAKKVHPFAFLVKPANKISLKHSIELAIENFNAKTLKKRLTLEQFPFLKQNLLIKEGNKLIKLNIENIHIIEVEEKYCSIYDEKKKFVVRISLKDILEKLANDKFMRIHRNYVVNIDRIIAIDLEKNLVQTEIKELPLGRKYRSEIINNKGYIS
ncbi:response regulator [Fulvivirgaceae bacterium BMA12]|uniref:Response regulator n=1 Tax=Agaribacillus aureus TaxID=3051825 RepID=A0ABT8L1C4_9BACT|nr:response regulator [Fulvivirgaceae bacterium BMA12]